jgi:uracil-DNA glycosylase
MPAGRAIPRQVSSGVRRPPVKPSEGSEPPASLAGQLAKAGGELQALSSDIRACRACEREGADCAFGSGFPLAKVFLLKDRPSKEDLHSGAAFTVEAEPLERAFARLQIPFAWVYGSTAVRCGPDAATEDQVKACADHLLVELEAVGPSVLVAFGPRAVGAVAALDGRCGLRMPEEIEQGVPVALRHGLTLIATEPLPEGVTAPDAKRRLWKHLQALPGLL